MNEKRGKNYYGESISIRYNNKLAAAFFYSIGEMKLFDYTVLQ